MIETQRRKYIGDYSFPYVYVPEILRDAQDDKMRTTLHAASLHHFALTINYQLKKMENENKSIWSKILKIVITVLTAVATTFGLQACGVL